MNPREHLRTRIAAYRSRKARALIHDARESYQDRRLLLDAVLPGHTLDVGARSALRRLTVLETAHRDWWGRDVAKAVKWAGGIVGLLAVPAVVLAVTDPYGWVATPVAYVVLVVFGSFIAALATYLVFVLLQPLAWLGDITVGVLNMVVPLLTSGWLVWWLLWAGGTRRVDGLLEASTVAGFVVLLALTAAVYVIAAAVSIVLWVFVRRYVEIRTIRAVGRHPSWMVAASGYLHVIRRFHDERRHWRRYKTSVALLAKLREVHWNLPIMVRNGLRPVSASRADVAYYVAGAETVASRLRCHERRLLAAHSDADVTAIVRDMATEVGALLAGDWPDPGDVQVRPWHHRGRALYRRLGPALLLAGAAVALPRLPGLDDGLPGLPGIQVALLLAAAGSLVAPDPGLGAFLYGAVRDSRQGDHGP